MAKSASGEDKANPVFLLATQAILALSGYLALAPKEKCSRFGHDKSVVDKAYSVKISGYWPRPFLRFYRPRLLLGP